MIRKIFVLSIFLFVCVNAAFARESFNYGSFGKVTVYKNSKHPSQIVLFISGDGGWNLGVVDMAKILADQDALVVGIDIVHYLHELQKQKGACCYPASDFENLSKFVQKKYGYDDYNLPILVGYSSGATLVYALLVQAPSTTFKGGISLGFCPDLEINKPFCKGNGLEFEKGPRGKGVSFLSTPELEVPWVALQGDIDQVCNPAETQKFVKQVRSGKIISLPKVGHGFSVPGNWLPQFKAAYKGVISENPLTPPAPNAGEVGDLPISEIVSSKAKKTNWMAFHITGDGGYGVTDKGISEELARNGIPVVTLNSLRYFWRDRTPDETARDSARIIDHYLNLWDRSNIIMIGYSFGADVLPFVINRLPNNLKQKIRLTTFIGLGSGAQFEFHLEDWLGESGKNSLPVKPELEKLRGMKMLCFYGEDDSDALCRSLHEDIVRSTVMKGGHRVGSNYGIIVEAILDFVNKNNH